MCPFAAPSATAARGTSTARPAPGRAAHAIAGGEAGRLRGRRRQRMAEAEERSAKRGRNDRASRPRRAVKTASLFLRLSRRKKCRRTKGACPGGLTRGNHQDHERGFTPPVVPPVQRSVQACRQLCTQLWVQPLWDVPPGGLPPHHGTAVLSNWRRCRRAAGRWRSSSSRWAGCAWLAQRSAAREPDAEARPVRAFAFPLGRPVCVAAVPAGEGRTIVERRLTPTTRGRAGQPSRTRFPLLPLTYETTRRRANQSVAAGARSPDVRRQGLFTSPSPIGVSAGQQSGQACMRGGQACPRDSTATLLAGRGSWSACMRRRRRRCRVRSGARARSSAASRSRALSSRASKVSCCTARSAGWRCSTRRKMVRTRARWRPRRARSSRPAAVRTGCGQSVR